MSINPNVDLTTYLNMEHPVKRSAAASVSAKTADTTVTGKTDGKTAAKDGDGFSFRDLIDIVNPLQHIPIVSTIYREITGDKISNASRIIGGALYGGFIGAAVGGINAIAVNETGKDVGELAMNKMGLGHSQTSDPAAQVKSADASASPSVAPGPAAPSSAVPGNIPVIEVHPQAKNEAKAEIQPQNTAQSFDAALNDPKTAVPKVVPSTKEVHPLSNALQAQQFRHFTTHDVAVSKIDADRAGLGLPQTKEVSDLKPVDAATATDATPTADLQEVPAEMMNAWVKYQAMKSSPTTEAHLAAFTAGDEAATN